MGDAQAAPTLEPVTGLGQASLSPRDCLVGSVGSSGSTRGVPMVESSWGPSLPVRVVRVMGRDLLLCDTPWLV